MLDKEPSPYDHNNSWLQSEKDQEQGNSQIPVACVSTINAPAHSELELVVETPQGAEGTWLLDGLPDDRLQVMTTHAVDCPSDQVAIA